MHKKDIRLVLFLWDVIVALLIFFSIIMMFETIIKKLLISYKLNDYKEIIFNIKDEYKTSIEFLNERPELPYKESIIEILNYLKLSALNKLKYEYSLIIIAAKDNSFEYIIGTNNQKKINSKKEEIDFNKIYLSAAKIPGKINLNFFNNLKNKWDENELKYLYLYYYNDTKLKSLVLKEYPDVNDSQIINQLLIKHNINNEKNYLEFKYSGKNYIGFSDFFPIGLNKNLDKKNIEKITPVIVIADLQNDFFYQITKIRNIFLLILGAIFLIVFIIKINNTFVITKEIKEISSTIKNESLAIENRGEIGTALKEHKLNFNDTSNLYDSYSSLNLKLSELGEIISGIADKELFVATLKNDKHILDPHETNMTVLFLDVQNFTTITEMHKEKAMSLINNIWNVVESIIFKFHGKINKYIGDAALVIFPELILKNKDVSTRNAILAGISILENVSFVSSELKIEFNFRIGIDYGKLVYGKTGSNRKYELGVIGDPVNTAARFENLNKQYNTNILLTETALKNSGFWARQNYKLSKEPVKEYSFYMIDRARPHGKKEAKNMFTILLKKEDQYRFIGSKNFFQDKLFDYFSNFITDFISNIKYWQDKNNKEGINIWVKMAKQIGKFYFENKFPVAEIFLNRLLKYEELLKFQSSPDSWLKQEEINIKLPDFDWIKYGTIELPK